MDPRSESQTNLLAAAEAVRAACECGRDEQNSNRSIRSGRPRQTRNLTLTDLRTALDTVAARSAVVATVREAIDRGLLDPEQARAVADHHGVNVRSARAALLPEARRRT